MASSSYQHFGELIDKSGVVIHDGKGINISHSLVCGVYFVEFLRFSAEDRS